VCLCDEREGAAIFDSSRSLLDAVEICFGQGADSVGVNVDIPAVAAAQVQEYHTEARGKAWCTAADGEKESNCGATRVATSVYIFNYSCTR
jgi:hypothetical protein